MISNLTKLEVKIGEKLYQLICECDSPVGAVHDALCQMKAHVVKMIQDAQQAEKPACASCEQPPPEDLNGQ